MRGPNPLQNSSRPKYPSRIFPLHYINQMEALTASASKASLSESSGDSGCLSSTSTSPSDGHLVDEDSEDEEDDSPDKDIEKAARFGRSSEEQLKVACNC